MMATITAIAAAITAFCNSVLKIVGLVEKTPEQKAQKVASDAKADQNSLNTTGRPK